MVVAVTHLALSVVLGVVGSGVPVAALLAAQTLISSWAEATFDRDSLPQVQGLLRANLHRCSVQTT